MRVLITGGTGLIGRRLISHLFAHGHTVSVLSRQPFRPPTLRANIGFFQWDGKTTDGWGHHIEEVDAVVNLAGAGIADKRWSDERKQILLESRLNVGNALVEAIRAAENKPKVFVQASAIGYYGAQKDDELSEVSKAGNDFLAGICKQWEDSTEAVEQMGVRRVIIRTGVVLDELGGAFPKMVMPFHLFAGGPIGNGKQWFSWIHHEDEVAAIRFLLENESAKGVFNLTAPNPKTNKQFAKKIGKTMHRPSFMPAPAFVFKILFGEMSTVLLDGQRVLPERLLEAGFKFKYPEAEAALQDLLVKKSAVKPEVLAQLGA